MRRSSADHDARCTPVQPLASSGRSTPLASMRCVDTAFPSVTVVTSIASPPRAEGVMQTYEAFSAGEAKAEAPGTELVQQPIHPSHFDPTPAFCAERDVVVMATRPSA